MGQNKIEKDFRDKLNQREITPSANAWDRLDAMLTVAEEKKPKRNYGWMYIAASILGFLFIGMVFFSQTEEMIDVGRNNIILENNQSPSETATAAKINPTTASQTIAVVGEPKKDTRPNPQNQSKINNPINASPQSNANRGLIANNATVPATATNTIITRTGDQTFGNQKADQHTTTAKVDELLAAVAPTPNPTAKSSVKVNSKSLLSQVDGELNLTFREKILHKVGKNYQEVAEAVSNRNIQQ